MRIADNTTYTHVLSTHGPLYMTRCDAPSLGQFSDTTYMRYVLRLKASACVPLTLRQSSVSGGAKARGVLQAGMSSAATWTSRERACIAAAQRAIEEYGAAFF